MARAGAVDGGGGLLGGLGGVDVGPGGGVDDDLVPGDGRVHGPLVGDVELGPGEPFGADAGGRAEDLEQVLAELAPGADDQPAGRLLRVAHWPSAAFCFSGSHQARLSRYQAMVAARPSSKETFGA